MTFDAPRPSTPLRHVLDEYRDGVIEVSDAHIVEFCEAIYGQPPIHPPEVREWHDPATLDAERFDLHRRRSIHVHCWSAEELASMLTGLVALGLIEVRLTDLYVHDDRGDLADPGDPGAGVVDIEFGLVLEKVADASVDPPTAARDLVRRWVAAVLDDQARDPQRVVALTEALARDVADQPIEDPAALVALPAALLAEHLVAQRAIDGDLREQLDVLAPRAAAADARLDAIVRSRSYRLATGIASPAQRIRRR